MDAIKPGLIGAAVEDVQQRLITLGASISDDERIAQAFGCEVVCYSRTKKDIPGVEFIELDELLLPCPARSPHVRRD